MSGGTIITGPINNKIQIAGKIVAVPTHVEKALLKIGNNVHNVFGGAGGKDGLVAVYLTKGILTKEHLSLLCNPKLNPEQNAKIIVNVVNAVWRTGYDYKDTRPLVLRKVLEGLIKIKGQTYAKLIDAALAIHKKILEGEQIVKIPKEIETPEVQRGEFASKLTETQDQEIIYNYIKTNFPKISEGDRKEIAKYLAKYGHEYGVDPKLVASLIARESGFNKTVTSKAGAKGLGQLMPVTCKVYKVKKPFNIQQNIIGTIKLFKWCLDKWKTYKSPDKYVSVKFALASYKEGYYGFKDRMYYKKGTGGYIEYILKHYDDLTPQLPIPRTTPKITTI